jgi:hypothetical protein
VFVENCGFDLSPLADVVSVTRAAHRVEFVSFDGLDNPPRYGRGYGEFKLLDYASENSRTVAAADAGTMLWKVTGRYRVLNITRIIRSAPSRPARHDVDRDAEKLDAVAEAKAPSRKAWRPAIAI